MFSNKNKTMRLIAAIGLMALPALVVAQGYYDDDIYYDASKAPKKQKTVKTRRTVADYPASDTYQVYTNNTRDVDEYNRHGAFLVADSISVDSLDNLDLFASTRRIERFHNGDIVAGSKDADLQAYYYSEPATVNIYVQNDPWYSPYWRWSWAFGSPSYYWNWSLGYYDPWWGPGWGPSWAWGWGPAWSWGPSWSWGWGGPAWGWGPGWGGPVWGGGPAWAGRPSTGIGSSGTHRPVTGVGSSSRYPTGSGTHGSAVRPGNNGYGTGAASARPGYSGMGSNPRPVQSVGTGSRPANGTHGVATGVRGRGNVTTTPSNNRSTNNSSWGNGSSWGGSRGGYSTGGGGSSRGGFSTGGGGGTRGRR